MVYVKMVNRSFDSIEEIQTNITAATFTPKYRFEPKCSSEFQAKY